MSLDDIQKNALEMAAIRGFSGNTLKDKVLVLVEEVGELASAVLRGKGDPVIEVADCQVTLTQIAKLLGMDGEQLEKVCLEKIESDKVR